MNNKRAVIFDLDGTLLDTLTDIAGSMNGVLARMGFPLHERDDYTAFVGGGIDVLAYRALPEDRRDESTVSRAVAAMREEYARRWSDTSRPYPGIPELLDELSHREILLAVLSNKLESFTKTMVKALLGSWEFSHVRGLEFGRPRKPDPLQATAIARDMHLDPDRIIFTGDSDVDIETALRAGMFPVGVLWGYQSRQQLASSGAEALIERPEELLGYL